MGISDRNFDSRLSFGSKINPVVVLIAIAMIVFVVLAFFKAINYVRLGPDADTDISAYFSQHILSWFALSDDTARLWKRPWTLLSYSFVHTGVWALFANMLWLWCFGFIFTDLTGFKKVVPVFIYGSLAGALVFLILGRWLPETGTELSYLTGSNPGILAVCIAATTVSPSYKVLPMLARGISLWLIALIFLVVNFATLPPNHPVLYLTYLASALTGYLFIFTLRRGFDGSEWMNRLYDWAGNLFNPEKRSAQRQSIKSALYYKTTQAPFTKSPKLTQKKVDELLDKINQKGYESLSTEEKEFLKRASREDLKK